MSNIVLNRFVYFLSKRKNAILSFFLNSEVSETEYRKLGAELTKKRLKELTHFTENKANELQGSS